MPNQVADSGDAEQRPLRGPGDVRRAHRRAYRRKPEGKRRPMVLEATAIALDRLVRFKSDAVWHRIARSVPVAGYSRARELERIRGFRSDGAESFVAVTSTLLQSCDIQRGFIGRPPRGGDHWRRYIRRDISQFALGRQDDSALRRTDRAIRCLVSLGWLTVRELHFKSADGTLRSAPALRWINLDRICDLLGTKWMLQRDRALALARQRGNGEPLAPSFPGSETQREGAAVAPPPPTPHATGDPPQQHRDLPQTAKDLLKQFDLQEP